MAFNAVKFPVRALGPNRVSIGFALPVTNPGGTSSNFLTTSAGGAVGDLRMISSCSRTGIGIYSLVLAQAGNVLLDHNSDVRGAAAGTWASIDSYTPSTKTVVFRIWNAAGTGIEAPTGAVLSMTLNFADTGVTPQ